MSTDGLIDRARKTSLVSVVAEAVSFFSDTPVFPKISTPMINAYVLNDDSCLCVAAYDCECFRGMHVFNGFDYSACRGGLCAVSGACVHVHTHVYE